MYRFKAIKIIITAFVLLVFSTSALANENGLIGYWNFDNVEDNIALDLSGNGLDGILSDAPVFGLEDYPFEELATVENGPCGKAVSFNGQTSKIVVDNFPGVNGNFTIELWFNMRSIWGSPYLL